MRNALLPTDIARPHAHSGQIDDAPTLVGRKRAAVDEIAAQLIDLAERLLSLENLLARRGPVILQAVLLVINLL